VNKGSGFRAFRARTVRALDQYAAAPLGKGEMTILKDMESLDQEHDQYMQDLKSGGQSDSD
jgi:hypothetical protein